MTPSLTMFIRRLLSAPRGAVFRADNQLDTRLARTIQPFNILSRCNSFYSSVTRFEQQNTPAQNSRNDEKPAPKSKRSSRSPPGKVSLRRAAVEAQISKDGRRRQASSEEMSAKPRVRFRTEDLLFSQLNEK